MSYDFIIQYCWDSLNSVNESLWRSNYIAEHSREHHKSNSMSWQIDDLMSMLVNKLATVSLIRTDKQYSCQVRSADSETEDLIWVLSLQTITWSKIRLTADNLERQMISILEKWNLVFSMSLNWMILMLWKINLVFSVWLKKFKSLTCCADKYLVNFTKNQKETSHLLWSEMKFWERWIMFLCLSRRWFKVDS